MSFADGPEIALPAGDVTVGVVRIGDTVRRPRQETSAAVAEYLTWLHEHGFDRAPRHLGVDASDRDVLTYLDGDVPGDPVEPWAVVDDVLPALGRLNRRLHDASEGFSPSVPFRAPVAGRPEPMLPDEPRLIAQRDITPQNTVFRDGQPWGVVDFDLSDRTTRSVDLANTAMHWIPLCDPADRGAAFRGVDVGVRLAALLDGYGRDVMSADAFLAGARLRFAGSYAIMRWNAEHLGGGWARMWDEGVGEVIRRRADWFEQVRGELSGVLA